MPLSHCLDCGREVSTRARSCPHCGRPRPVRKCGDGLTVLLLIAGLLAALAAAAVVSKKCCPFRSAAFRCRSIVAPEVAPPAPAKFPPPIEER
ncbi:MAG: hypothetical protein HY716_04425 [Planctomycetes bacterium]|nr:hypothetical protein [Planctomycetota bacterium]